MIFVEVSYLPWITPVLNNKQKKFVFKELLIENEHHCHPAR